jgi:AAA+ superfamily predicted ATPase
MSLNLSHSLSFLRALLRYRLAEYLGQTLPDAPALPQLADDDHPFSRFIQHRRLNADEYVALITGLAAHADPHLFDEEVQAFLPQGGDFPPLGGVKGTNFRGFLPTGETVQFLLGGVANLERRMAIHKLFGSQHFFGKERILHLEEMKAGEPVGSGRLILDPEYVELFLLGYISPPKLSGNFPAQHLQSELEWSDLVLPESTMHQLREVETWLRHNDRLLYDWKMAGRIKPGYRALFYGPPGTGKTMAATLLGKFTGHEVFRIDLSTMVSKYIGETEKNLASLFERAENKEWILFFDEADALFGKRTSVRDAHDRFANQEVSYLLQRIEDFPGLSILASNFKTNVDEAFTRRFNSMVYFPMPRPAERLLLWQKTFPTAVRLETSVNVQQIADKYELTGSNILNIVHYCCLQALEANTDVITQENLMAGIRRELIKENKII